MRTQYWVGAIAAVLCAICVRSSAFLYLMLFLLYSLVLVAIAIFGTIYVHYKLTNRDSSSDGSIIEAGRYATSHMLFAANRPSIFADPPGTPLISAMSATGTDATSEAGRNATTLGNSTTGTGAGAGQFSLIFGRTVDGLLLQIIANAMRDLVTPALETVVANPRRIVDLLRDDLWLAIEKLHERASRIDAPKLIACDFVTKVTLHLQKIRQQAAVQASGESVPESSDCGIGTGAGGEFCTASYLTTVERELDFLKKIGEILIIFLLPRGYSLSPIKDLLSEVLAYRVLHPAIRYLTSPEFINQQIVECIETKLVAVAIQKRSNEYAANFEDFLRIIDMTQTVDELHSIRASIVNDILQATTMETLVSAQRSSVGLFHEQDASEQQQSTSASRITSADLTAGLKLKKYIQQLAYAKSQCEKCLMRLGWEGNVSNDVDLSTLDILSTVAGRRHLTAFLEPLNAGTLVGYYTTVEELRRAPKSAWHQLGAEIFYTYVRAPNSELPLDRGARKRMEAFLVGEGGPDVFYEVQRDCLLLLERKYHQPFLLSEEYARLKNSLTQEDFKEIVTACGSVAGGGIGSPNVSQYSTDSQDSDTGSSVAMPSSVGNGGDNSGGAGTGCVGSSSGPLSDQPLVDLSNHSQYARNKLDQLDEKLANKQQALEALKHSLKPDSKLLLMLEREIEWLRGERRQLESHLLRTEVWSEYLGRWRAIVESVNFSDDREPPQFMIVVQVDEMNDCGRDGVATALDATESISTGWVVVRSLSQFHALHRKLRPMASELRQLDLPSNNAFKLFLLKNDRALLERAKAQVQRYLTFILEDDHLNQSEAVYEFLSPSSERLKQGGSMMMNAMAGGGSSGNGGNGGVHPSPSKKSKFSLATLFRGNSDRLEQLWSAGTPMHTLADYTPDADPDQVSLYLDGLCCGGSGRGEEGARGPFGSLSSYPSADTSPEVRDSIAEPLYALLGELFDLGGVFRWLRKSLISFVQITYGQTINRQLRESINAMFDEPMLHAYASAVLKSCWPGGGPLSPHVLRGAAERTDDQREMTANAARSLLQDNIPDLLCSLIGAQNARQGTIKLFEALQNPLYNKQLFYDLLETLMLELFPEIRQQKQSRPTAREPNHHTGTSPQPTTTTFTAFCPPTTASSTRARYT
ncbi:sorting nexin-25-like [Anopheles darlingi]|uniref:sorting nexin-25-like n=1 Tax=Anopheles darlingi TaxID=43151 RepID=UPI002100224F|nr:sorting nexin-25-like [Anopheles darlingi]XP_049529987.1 sorting nexin-25-like [Anopheles darlingi]